VFGSPSKPELGSDWTLTADPGPVPAAARGRAQHLRRELHGVGSAENEERLGLRSVFREIGCVLKEFVTRICRSCVMLPTVHGEAYSCGEAARSNWGGRV